MPNENVRLITPGMGREIGAALVKAVPDNLPFKVGKAWIDNQAMVNRRVREMLSNPERAIASAGADFEKKLKDQEDFWRYLFREDFNFDPAHMLVWPRLPGYDRLLVVPRGHWGNRLFEKYAEMEIQCWRGMDDMDRMTHSSGSPFVDTARWFREGQESDEELRGNSANDLNRMLIPGITLPELELYGLVYFDETKQHLDLKGSTLISGSRYHGNYVPCASFESGKFSVYGVDHQTVRPGLCARAAG